MDSDMREYYVIAFDAGDARGESDWLHQQGLKFLSDAKRRMLGKDPLPPHEYAEVFSLPEPFPEQLRSGLEAAGLWYETPEQYRAYAKVYFLNDSALRMFRENGIQLDVLRVVTDSDLPDRSGSSLRGPYVFADPAFRSESAEVESSARVAKPLRPPVLPSSEPLRPVRAIGIPEHGLHLAVGEGGVGVELENHADQPVVAHELVWVTRWAHGGESRSPQGYVNVSALRFPGQYLSEECVAPGATAQLGTNSFGSVEFGAIGADGNVMWLGPGGVPREGGAAEIIAVLDGAFFADGTFVGPNETGCFEDVKASFEATHDLASELLDAVRSGLPADEAMDRVLAFASEDFEHDHVSLPEPGESMYGYYRARQAVEFLNVRAASGADGVLRYAAELVATTPRLRRR